MACAGCTTVAAPPLTRTVRRSIVGVDKADAALESKIHFDIGPLGNEPLAKRVVGAPWMLLDDKTSDKRATSATKNDHAQMSRIRGGDIRELGQHHYHTQHQ